MSNIIEVKIIGAEDIGEYMSEAYPESFFALCDYIAEYIVRKYFIRHIYKYASAKYRDEAASSIERIAKRTADELLSDRLFLLSASGVVAKEAREKGEVEPEGLAIFRMRSLIKKAEAKADECYAEQKAEEKTAEFIELLSMYIESAPALCRTAELELSEGGISILRSGETVLKIFSTVPGISEEEAALSCLLKILPKRIIINGSGHRAFAELLAKIYGERAKVY